MLRNYSKKRERNLKINARLEEVLLDISSQMSAEEIEKRSRVQKRGRFSDNTEDSESDSKSIESSSSPNDSNETPGKQMSLFDYFPQD